MVLGDLMRVTFTLVILSPVLIIGKLLHKETPDRKFRGRQALQSFFQLSESAFNTTEIELNAIAPPLIQGANNPMPAIGIPMAL